MEEIYFATTNEGKLREVQEILGIKVKGTSLEIDEIQSLDPKKVAVAKARAYFDKLKKPIFVEDVSLCFRALGGLPGTYINDFSKRLGNKGLADLLLAQKERGAIAITTIVYIDTKGEHVFEGKVKGSIAKKPHGNKGFGWDSIFIPEGETKTFGEMKVSEKNKYSMRAIALKKFKKYLES